MILGIRPRDLETIAILEEVSYGPDREDSSIHISIPIIFGSCQDKEAVISVTADLIKFSQRYHRAAAWFIPEYLIKKLEAADDILVSDNPAYGGILLSRETDSYHLQIRLVKQFGMYTVDVKWHNDRVGDEYSLPQYYAYLRLRPKIKDFCWESLDFTQNIFSLKIFLDWEEQIEKIKEDFLLPSLSFKRDYEIVYYIYDKIKTIGEREELIRQVDYVYDEKKGETILEVILWNYQVRKLKLQIIKEREEKLVIKGENFDSETFDFLKSFVNLIKMEAQLITEQQKKYFSERPIYDQR